MQNIYKFFDKNGFHLIPEIDEDGIYNINLTLNDISSGLFETEQLHIFEEVYTKEDITQNLNKLPIINDSIFLVLLQTINTITEKGSRCKYENLIGLFDVETFEKDVVYEYCLKFNEYIEIFKDTFAENSKNYSYILTQKGKQLLSFGNFKIEEEILKSQGYVKKLVKPRFKNPNNPKKNYFLFFKWKNDKKLINNCLNVFGLVEDDIEIEDNNSILGQKNSYPSYYAFENELLNDPNEFLYPSEKKSYSNLNISENFKCDNAFEDFFIPNAVFGNKKILSNYSKYTQEPLTINISGNSDIEGYYKNTLEVFIIDDNLRYYKFLNVHVEVNIIGEDERLPKLLENFGRQIDSSDFYVVRDYDLDDDKLDYIKINEKRKELLIQSEEIFPCLGSYKSLYNGLKWLGYQDIKIREYFYNIKTWKNDNIDYSYIDIPVDYTDTYKPKNNNKSEYTLKKYSKLILSDEWKKTTRLGIIYPFNQVTDELNEYDLPVVKTSDVDFNAEELIVKLYGLRKFLYKYLLPHNARIINITLEGIYFTKVQFTNWNYILPILNLNKKPNFDFNTLYPKQRKLDLLDLVRLFAKHKNQLYWVDKFKTLQDFVNSNKNISDFNNLRLHDFNETEIETEDEGYTPSLKLIFNYIIEYLENNFQNYQDLEKFITKIIQILNCDSCVEKFENNTLEGGIFLLNLIENKITFKDLVNVPIGFFEFSFDKKCLLPNKYDLNSYDEIISNEEILECSKHNDLCQIENNYPKIKWNFEFFNIHKNSQVIWKINHQDNLFCRNETGTLKNKKQFLFIAPHIGKYDVECVLMDDYNYPLTKMKTGYLEVVEEDCEIYAIGKNCTKDGLANFDSTKKFFEISGNFQNTYTNYVKNRTFNESKNLTFNDLVFSNYLDNQYYLNNSKYAEINNIDIFNNKISIDNWHKFIPDFNDYSKNWDNLYIIKNTRDYTFENIPILEIQKNSIIFNQYSNINLKNREILNIYEKLDLYNFTIENDTITIHLDDTLPINIFRNDSLITLSENLIDNETGKDKSKTYKTSYINYDFNKKIVSLKINDINKDLVFSQDETHDTNVKYNYSNWQKLTFKYNINTYRVEEQIDNKIILKGDLKKLYLFKKSNNNFYFDSGLLDFQFFKVPIENVKIEFDTNNKNICQLYLGSDFEICDLLPGSKIIWNVYDVHNAKQNTKQERLDFDIANGGNYKFENLQNQTFNTLCFNSKYITEFKITNINNLPLHSPTTNNIDGIPVPKPSILLNDIEYVLDIPLDQQKYIDAIKHPYFNKDRFKIQNLCEYLNNIKSGLLKHFYYSISKKELNTIIATSKGTHSTNIFKISAKGLGVENSLTYPKINWFDKQITEFPNIQNPDITNHLCLSYLENKVLLQNFTKDEDIIVSSYNRGKYDFGVSFMKKDDFELNTATPLIITISNKEYFNLKEWVFEWTLVHNDTNRILLKSNKNYINYNINLNGSYSIHLKLTNIKTNKEIIKDKFSWFFKN